MSIRLTPIVQQINQIMGAPFQRFVMGGAGGLHDPAIQNITNVARDTTRQFRTTITEILNTTRRYDEEQANNQDQFDEISSV